MGGALFDESPGSVADEVGVLRQAAFVRGGQAARQPFIDAGFRGGVL